jgi:hypothetical protein
MQSKQMHAIEADASHPPIAIRARACNSNPYACHPASEAFTVFELLYEDVFIPERSADAAHLGRYERLGFELLELEGESVPPSMRFEIKAGKAITTLIGQELVCMRGVPD